MKWLAVVYERVLTYLVSAGVKVSEIVTTPYIAEAMGKTEMLGTTLTIRHHLCKGWSAHPVVPVVAYTEGGKSHRKTYHGVYESQKRAATINDCWQSNINHAALGKQLTAYGYCWQTLEAAKSGDDPLAEDQVEGLRDKKLELCGGKAQRKKK